MKEFLSRVWVIRDKWLCLDINDWVELRDLQYEVLTYMSKKKKEIWLSELTMDEYRSKFYRTLKSNKAENKLSEEWIKHQIKEGLTEISKTILDLKEDLDNCSKIDKFIVSSSIIINTLLKAEWRNFNL